METGGIETGVYFWRRESTSDTDAQLTDFRATTAVLIARVEAVLPTRWHTGHIEHRSLTPLKKPLPARPKGFEPLTF